MKAASPLWSTCRWCGTCACTFVLWTLWLLLGALLALQLYLLAARQLAVPAFILRALESRLAASHLTVRFNHATFSPSGRLLAENIRLESQGCAEPLFTADALDVRLDPWALLAGHFDPREVRIASASFFVPAMLSPSGRTEALLSDCNADLLPRQHAIKLAQFNCRVGNLTVTGHGEFLLPASANTAATGVLPIADFFSQNYPRLSHQLAGYTNELASLDEPELQVELTPSDTRGALVVAVLSARAIHRETPWPMHATELRAIATMPMLGHAAPATLDISAAELSLPAQANAQDVHVHVQGVVWPSLPRLALRSVDFSAASFAGFSLEGTDLLAHLSPDPLVPIALLTLPWHELPRVQAEIAGVIAGGPVSLHAVADFKAQNARVGFDAAVGPALIKPLSNWTHSDLPKLLALTSPVALHGSAAFTDGWHLENLSTRVEAEHFAVQGVPVDTVSGQVDLHGHDLRVTDVVLHQRDNLALGSYTMDTATLDYRFLFHGELRPLDVSPWFPSWWIPLWKDILNLDFPVAPPVADVDVHGRWGNGQSTDVFAFVDAASPVMRSVPFDRARVILHILGNLEDIREVFFARGARTARGHFTRLIDPVKDTLLRMDFDVTSNLDLTESARIFGKSGEEIMAPFKFDQPPTLHASGSFDGPAAPDGEHHFIQLAVASTGVFKLFDFPINDVSFDATLRDNDIDLPRINATFSDGALTGHAFLSGADDVRRLRFDLHLANASLGRTITTVDDFLAAQENRPPDPPTEFIQRAADIRLDLSATAAGHYHDPLSFSGSGTATLAGAELGQLHLLGLLSQLLGFTSLRFTAAQANFTIGQNKLLFPEVKVTGANSAINAKGSYWLDRKTLDFNAKVYPFGESKFAPSKLASLVLTPFSALAEVKLTGPLDKPLWAFAYGPTNFLRKLTQPKSSPPDEKSSQETTEGENFSPYLGR
ncbi:MAG TPA: AsmA-like C-terminal region-containing protein [Opitutaceae bacterium]|nr:AsmA-like C-terminal region-containing protein [Opitutaceae bacterium]